MLRKARQFFSSKGILEVDVPILSERASIDAHIDLVEANCLGKRAFLHSSPEYGMKRLLSEGIGDIYQLSHVFRNGERGVRHNPEFTMVEWYRCGVSFDEMIEDTIEFVSLFLERPPDYEKLSYQEAFTRYASDYPSSLELRDRLFAFEVEPHLKNAILHSFPPEQAALAQIGSEGAAERFELFINGFELANGYHELTDPAEQQKRLERANKERMELGKQSYPLDSRFVEALARGMPDCCGVAVGFDRLMMLRHGVESIDEVIPFTWEES